MFKTYQTLLARILAACLLLQPCLILANAPTAPTIEKPVSELLNSPLKKELALLSQFSITPLLNNDKIALLGGYLPVSTNDKILTVLRNKTVISWNDIAAGTYFKAQEFANKQARIKLFADLQFSNRDGQSSIVSNLGKTITRAGQACFLNLVAQEHADWTVTKQRQDFVRTLVESPDLLKQIKEQLTIIKNQEETFAKQIPLAVNPLEAMSKAKKLGMFMGLEVALFYGCYLRNPSAYAKPFLATNAYFACMYLLGELSKTEGAGNLGAFLLNALWITLMGGITAAGLATLTNYDNYGLKTLQLLNKDKKTYDKLDRVILPSACAAVVYGIYQLLKVVNNANKDAFYDAKAIAHMLRGVESLQKTLQKSELPILSQAYGLQLSKQLSGKWKALVSKAKAESFNKDKEHHLLSTSQPRVLNLMQLLGETVSDFSKMLQFYGEIDAYAAMAQLYLDTQNTTNQFGEPVTCCFVDLIENSEESILKAQDMWHPIIPQAVVRTNSITLGGSAQNPRNAIITGPNAAGKSVSMKALLVNIILGQTFGVACAESFAFTPYTKIIARFTSADNTAGGQSKFMVEAADVVSLLRELESLQPGEKAFVVTDELFSGTEVQPAILLSSQLCTEVATMKNVNYLLATHYKDLTQLQQATNNAFANYKVTAFVDSNNLVSYPFKLDTGIGDVNVAFDIFLDQMRKQGLSNERLETIIKNAKAQNIVTT